MTFDPDWWDEVSPQDDDRVMTPTQRAIEDLGIALAALADALWHRLADRVVPPGCCW